MADFGDLLVAKFFRATLKKSVSVNDTTVELDDISGIPIPTGNQYFYLTLVEGDKSEVVKIESVNVGTNALTLLNGTSFTKGFPASSSRAELWFTAEAFEDMQTYLTSLAQSSYPGVDNATIEAATELKVKLLGILAGHLADGAVTTDKLYDNSVDRDKIKDGEVFNVALATGIDAKKLANVTGTIDPALVANLNFSNIDYTDGGTPIGGDIGSIHFTFKT
jgi:hypothetical protein